MNCGHLRLRYIFNTDGSYNFNQNEITRPSDGGPSRKVVHFL